MFTLEQPPKINEPEPEKEPIIEAQEKIDSDSALIQELMEEIRNREQEQNNADRELVMDILEEFLNEKNDDVKKFLAFKRLKKDPSIARGDILGQIITQCAPRVKDFRIYYPDEQEFRMQIKKNISSNFKYKCSQIKNINLK